MELSLGGQEEIFVDSMFKYCLFNYVECETYKGGNTLDFILTNDTGLIRNVRSDANSKFSDHHFNICYLDIEYEKEVSNCDVIHYLSNILNYGWKKGTTEQ